MGKILLGDVLANWSSYELDESIYLTAGDEVTLMSEVSIVSLDENRGRTFGRLEYLLGIEQIRDVVEGLEQQLGRATTPEERLPAVLFYRANDAFMPL
ncbi:MAG: hypothetical protein R3B70_43185 [Polyangiaceae bacterium]